MEEDTEINSEFFTEHFENVIAWLYPFGVPSSAIPCSITMDVNSLEIPENAEIIGRV